MTEFCHRCGEELPAASGGAAYCPHCGAPQIRFIPPEAAPDDPSAASAPPPRPIEWRTAIGCALVIGFGAAILNVGSASLPVVGRLSWLWILIAPALALMLYQRRCPQARMDRRIGARIGLVVGLAQLCLLAVLLAVAGVVARFGLHAMSGFDAQLLQNIQQGQRQAESWAAALNAPPPDYSYMNTPEARVWILLLDYAAVGGIMLAFSALAGAIGGNLRMRRGSI